MPSPACLAARQKINEKETRMKNILKKSIFQVDF